MSEITKDDVQHAVRDELRDMQNAVAHIHGQVERIEQRTSDLDESQREIRDLSQKIQHLYPQLEQLVRGGQDLERLRMDLEDVKQRTQNIEQGIQQITNYLQEQHKVNQQNLGFKRD